MNCDYIRTRQGMSAIWENGTTVYDKTAGIMQTYFIYPDNSHQIVLAAEDGDPVAIRLADAMNDAVFRIEHAPAIQSVQMPLLSKITSAPR